MLFTADLHLGDETDTVKIRQWMTSKLFDTVARLREMVDRAAETRQSLVIGGDVFDTSSPKPYVVHEFFSILLYAASAGVPIFILAGNHDASISWTALLMTNGIASGSVTIIHEPTYVVIDGMRCFVLPHLPKSDEAELFDTIGLPRGRYDEFLQQSYKEKKFHVLLTHADILGHTASAERVMEAGNAIVLPLPQLPRVRYILTGHVHAHQILQHGGIHAYYSGSLVPHSFGEIEDEKCYIEFVEGSEPTFVAFKTPMTRQYKQIKINMTDKAEFDATDEQLKRRIGDTLLKVIVVVKDRRQIDLRAIIRRLSQFATVLRYEIVETSKMQPVVLNRSKQRAVHRGSLQHGDLLKQALSNLDREMYNDKAIELAQQYGEEIIQSCSKR